LSSQQSRSNRRFTSLRLAWLAVKRRKRRSIISIVLLALVIASGITIASTIEEFPTWISALSASSPNILLAYDKNSTFVGLLPVNSTIPISDLGSIQQVNGIVDVTPLIIKDIRTSLSQSPSLVVGLDLNFWQLGLGLNSGHWPQPSTFETVVTVGNAAQQTPSTVTVNGQVFQVVGVAISADLFLVNSIVISYATAQKTFNLGNLSSIFAIQLASNADSTTIASKIAQVDPDLATVDLSTSSQLLGTVSSAANAISSAVVLVEAIFTFAILTTLTLSGISSRRWEYGLISTYGSRASTSKVVLIENWITFALAVIPAAALSIGVLAFFTYYFDSLFGTTISAYTALSSSALTIFNLTTVLSYVGAFVAATLGTFLAVRTVLRRSPSELLAESHP
jgi:hypothetical protein